MERIIFDAHCDTIYELRERGARLRSNDLCVDLERLKEFDGYIQVFAAYIDRERIKKQPFGDCVDAFKECDDLIGLYHTEAERNADMFAACADFGGILKALEEKKTAGILAIEGADALEGELSNLNYFYDRGVRLITLTWNHDNELSGSIAGDSGGGLTEFGREAVCAMFKMGIIVDVSHISKKGFWDVYELAEKYKKPLIASHSNAYSICAHPRNLDDEQIKAVVETGGCIGINFYADFLSENGEVGVDDILKHMEHMIKLGAGKNIGFGTDFDGMSRTPSGVSGVQSMGDVIKRMEKSGFSQEFVKNISYYNFLNCFRKIL